MTGTGWPRSSRPGSPRCTRSPTTTSTPPSASGDLVLQLSAGHADTVLHALRDIARHTRGGMQAAWRIDGFASPPRPAGTDAAQPAGLHGRHRQPGRDEPGQMDSLVWVQPDAAGEPAWTAGGSYQVVRLIRMLVEFWDRVTITEQENMIGRRRDTGAPLDGKPSIDATPRLRAGPDRRRHPAHRAHPAGQPADPADRRQPHPAPRATTTTGASTRSATWTSGPIFTCYQQDIKRQFEAVQKRLIDEPLVDYISPFGGGYFFALPGVRDATDYFGRTLLA